MVREDASAIGTDEALLVETFGLRLLSFLCGTDEPTMLSRLEGVDSLGPSAESVLTGSLVPIAQMVGSQLAERPGFPRVFALEFLALPVSSGKTGYGVALRSAAGAPIPEEVESAAGDDQVKECLVQLAVDSYAVLIAPQDDWLLHRAPSLFRHPLRERLQGLIQSDENLSRLFPNEDAGLGHSGVVYSSVGQGGTFQDVRFAETLIGSAWDIVSATREDPTLLDLVDQVTHLVDVVRDAVRGIEASVPAKVVFTGFKTQGGRVIETPWGVLRPVQPWELARLPQSAATQLEGRVSGTHAGGDSVEVAYAGEMVLETSVPFIVAIRDGIEDPMLNRPWPVPTGDLQYRADMTQLAALLSTDRDLGGWITPRTTWTWIGNPLGFGSHFGWSDPRSGSGFMPAELTSQECDELEEWLVRVDDAYSSRVSIAVRRFLTATNSRVDMADRLVDSVIVWENLFGTPQGEPRLRVSGAIAWLLETDAASREELQGRLKRLYDYRSKIVHGAEPDPALLGEHANEALIFARRMLVALFKDRPDLLTLGDGSARSLRLLMGG